MQKKFTTSGKTYGVVLGKRLTDEGKPVHELVERLSKILSLYREGIVDAVIVSGGRANPLSPYTEGEVMRDYLLAHGVKAEDIVVEQKSMTTLQNGKFCKKILSDRGAKEVVLVTSSYHLYRWYLNPRRIFRFYGIKTTCYHSVDLHVTVEGAGDPMLVLYRGEKPTLPDGRTYIYKDMDTPIQEGKSIYNYEEKKELLFSELKNIYGETDIFAVEKE